VVKDDLLVKVVDVVKHFFAGGTACPRP